MKQKVLIVRITEEQENILREKAQSLGFNKKSDYVRFVLFMPDNVDVMIKKIYKKVVEDAD